MLVLPAEGYRRYSSGEPIQVALADVSVDVREQLISGTDPACWERLYGGDNE